MAPTSKFSRIKSARPTDAGPRWRLAFVRAIIWSLIGLIYAPLFIGLEALLSALGWGVASLPLAATLASAVGAVLYGARELALIATLMGVTIGLALLILLAQALTLLDAALIAALLAALIGFIVPFPRRCSRHVSGKALAGLMAGGGVSVPLALALTLGGWALSPIWLLALLVAVGALIYVLSVRYWILLSRRLCLEARPCYLIEGLAMALLAGVAAGSLWLISAPLAGLEDGLWLQTSEVLHRDLLAAIVGAMFGGALAGFLLELLRFGWVHDL
ncbi:MAG: hypothetical protein JXM75_13220 [Chromatiaceae bacterium]|nr:hypothetical protein [Chromatiaceae bacterium]